MSSTNTWVTADLCWRMGGGARNLGSEHRARGMRVALLSSMRCLCRFEGFADRWQNEIDLGWLLKDDRIDGGK